MANFKPLKKYLLILIDQFSELEKFTSPFLDVGCGIGDISLHYAQKGFSGLAIDLDEQTVKIAKKNLENYPQITVEQKNVFDLMGKFKTIFVCDVLEHIENDHLFIKHLYELLDDHGQIIISVPILSSEWRWDDDFYGHVRRYEIPDLIYLLGQNNLRVRQIWDFTFPFFWLIRRIYTKIIPKKIIFKDPLNNTKNSARQSAWDHGILTALFEKILWWDLLFKIQIKFKNHLVGCECVLIATKE